MAWVEVMRFSVIGEPRTQGSKRAFAIKRGGVYTGQTVMSDDDPRLKDWRYAVSCEASSATLVSALDEAVLVDVTFFLPRPRGHYGTGKNATILKPSAPPFPHTGKDTDKMQRAVGDALKKVVYVDDSRVTDWLPRKRWSDDNARRPSAEVYVYRWEGEPPPPIPPMFVREQGAAPTPQALTPPEPPSVFDRFWSTYPSRRRLNRPECEQFWAEENLDDEAERIIGWLGMCKAGQDWQKERGRFVPGALKWLQRAEWRQYAPAEESPQHPKRSDATLARIAEERIRERLRANPPAEH